MRWMARGLFALAVFLGGGPVAAVPAGRLEKSRCRGVFQVVAGICRVVTAGVAFVENAIDTW